MMKKIGTRRLYVSLIMAVTLVCLLWLTGCPGETPAPKVTGISIANEAELEKTKVVSMDYSKPTNLKLHVHTDDGNRNVVTVSNDRIALEDGYLDKTVGETFDVTVTHVDPLYPGNVLTTGYAVTVIAADMTLTVDRGLPQDAVDGWLDLSALVVLIGYEGASQSTSVSYMDTPSSFSFSTMDGDPLTVDGNRLGIGFGRTEARMIYVSDSESAETTFTINSPSLLSPPDILVTDLGDNRWTVSLSHATVAEGTLDILYSVNSAVSSEAKVDEPYVSPFIVEYTSSILSMSATASVDVSGMSWTSEVSDQVKFAPKLANIIVGAGLLPPNKDSWIISVRYEGAEPDVAVTYSILADGVVLEGYDNQAAGMIDPVTSYVNIYLPYIEDDRTLTAKAKISKEGFLGRETETTELEKIIVSVDSGEVSFSFDTEEDQSIGTWSLAGTAPEGTIITASTTRDDTQPVIDQEGTDWTISVPYDSSVDTGENYDLSVTFSKSGYAPYKVSKELVAPGRLLAPEISSVTRTSPMSFSVTLDYPGQEEGVTLQYAVRSGSYANPHGTEPDEYSWLTYGGTPITVSSKNMNGSTVWARAVKEGATTSSIVKSDQLLMKLVLSHEAPVADDLQWRMDVELEYEQLADLSGLRSALSNNYAVLVYEYGLTGGDLLEKTSNLVQPTVLYLPLAIGENPYMRVRVSAEGFESSNLFATSLPDLIVPSLSVGSVAIVEESDGWKWIVPVTSRVKDIVVFYSLGQEPSLASPFVTVRAEGVAEDIVIPYDGTIPEMDRTLHLKQQAAGLSFLDNDPISLPLLGIVADVSATKASLKQGSTDQFEWIVHFTSEIGGASYSYNVGPSSDTANTRTVVDGGAEDLDETPGSVKVSIDYTDDPDQRVWLTEVSKAGFTSMTEVKSVSLSALDQLSTPLLGVDKEDELSWKIVITDSPDNSESESSLQWRYSTDPSDSWQSYIGPFAIVFPEGSDEVTVVAQATSSLARPSSEIIRSFERAAAVTFEESVATEKSDNPYPVVTASSQNPSATVKVCLVSGVHEISEDTPWYTNGTNTAKVAIIEDGVMTSVVALVSENGKMSRQCVSDQKVWNKSVFEFSEHGPLGGIIIHADAENGSFGEAWPITPANISDIAEEIAKRQHYCLLDSYLEELSVHAQQVLDGTLTRGDYKKLLLELPHTVECEDGNRCYLHDIIHAGEGNDILNVDTGSLMLSTDLNDFETPTRTRLADTLFSLYYPEGGYTNHLHWRMSLTLRSFLPIEHSTVEGHESKFILTQRLMRMLGGTDEITVGSVSRPEKGISTTVATPITLRYEEPGNEYAEEWGTFYAAGYVSYRPF